MLVSVVSPDLSHNCLGRAHVLAQLLKRNYEVEIVGAQFQNKIWEPIRDEYNYKSVKTGRRVYQLSLDITELLEKISGDVVYVSKPRISSYGVSLLRTLGSEIPLILDIDDWESGFRYDNHSRTHAYLKGIPHLINLNSFYYTRCLELISKITDTKTVSNTFLQNKFGGKIIPHARDTKKFCPEKYDKSKARQDLGLPPDEFLVLFSGTPRPHKGVKELARAVNSTDRDDILTVVVGAQDSDYVDKVRQAGGNSIMIRGMQPFNKIPKWIAAADVVAIPQKDTLATQGQLPAKVFDAMAMAKPIVATSVSDLSQILEDCGVVVPPDSIPELSTAIERLAYNEQYRELLGQRARRKCIKNYSYDAVAPRLAKVVESVI